MFATAITAWRRSHPDICSRFPTVAPAISDTVRLHRRRAGVDRIDQRPRRRQAVHREAISRGRYAAVGPLLSHGDPPPPLDLAHEEQSSALALRKQHGQALTFQWMERVSDHQ
ncbi:hypothetical protein Ari01nite_78750 [Paractinoplanes rishiriensis]|uniref:Uncharacterized protein n=1 Tax=Paractinoplanes rishiriensis TaxID=1050105 RepID=A0A919K432_9ACTN|nr:hypothetical protein Ari01nite_78750 [Actinoplanes rishiriensis]